MKDSAKLYRLSTIYWNATFLKNVSPINRNWTAPWSNWNLVISLIYVAYGYSNEKKQIFSVRVIHGYPCTCLFPYGNFRTSLGKVQKTWWRNNIASNVRVATECLLKLSLPEIGVRPWAQIKWGLGTSSPQTWLKWGKTSKSHLK